MNTYMNLMTLTPEDILSRRIPLKELLEDSVYYPACGTDGRPIKYCNTIWRKFGVNSFVYCDFDMSEERFLGQLKTVLGYHVLAHRSLSRDEYIPEGWTLELEGHNPKQYYDTFLGAKREFPPFAHWAVFERDSGRNPMHGPERFSLIYVGGEGLATFQQFYCHHHIAPRMLCFIQCWGFAGNWTDFTDPDAAFATTLRRHPECTPEYVCIGTYDKICGVLRIKGTEYLGARFVKYASPRAVEKSLGYKPICIRNSVDASVHVARRGDRTFLLMSLYAGHLSYAVYDVTDSEHDIETIAANLVMHEDKLLANPEKFLNNWIGFKESTHHDCLGRSVPELDLELGSHRTFTDLAVKIVNACLDFYRNEGLNICTERMRAYLDWALDNLQGPDGGPMSQKVLEARTLCMHMNTACALMGRHGTHI